MRVMSRLIKCIVVAEDRAIVLLPEDFFPLILYLAELYFSFLSVFFWSSFPYASYVWYLKSSHMEVHPKNLK